MSSTSDRVVDEVDLARGREYALLGTLLLRSPDADLMSRLAELRGDSSALGRAHAELAGAAGRIDAEEVAREYFDLFVGVGRGELLPYASYYLTGFLHARPLARLRQDLQEIGVERAAALTEPEDHAAILFNVMAALATGEIAAPPGTDRTFFGNHLAPWIGRFFDDLTRAKAARFYAPVGALGKAFIAIEGEAFAFRS